MINIKKKLFFMLFGSKKNIYLRIYTEIHANLL